MDNAAAVRASYPRAVAVFEEPIAELEQDAPLQSELWAVFESGDPGAEELGRGEAEEDAWEDAARNLAK